MSFEWQTEDERDWEQPEGAADGRGPDRRRLWLLFFVALIGAGVYLGWRQVQQRVEAGAEAVREEVRASFSLAQRAAAERDQELFVSLLSGRSVTWTDAQRERAERGLLFAETGRLFAFEPAAAEASTPAVELNPEMTEAALSVRQPFLINIGSGLQETIVLTQTHVFRRGNERWLLSPPDEEYWGPWQTRNGRALQMIYPQRDEEIALRLHDDLERKLFEMCRTLVDCRDDFIVLLRMETDAQSVLSVAGGEDRLSGGREMVVPAPSLVGLPLDEAAYAALFRGYARHVLAAAMINLLEYNCCRMATYQEALLDWQLSRLGLRPAPLRPEAYRLLSDWSLQIDYLAEAANVSAPRASDGEAPVEVHAFIDFLRSRLSLRQDPLGDMQAALADARSFWHWVSELTPYESTNPHMLQQDWEAFVWNRAREVEPLAQVVPATLLPQQDLLAMCGGQTLDLYRYSFRSGQWARELETGFDYAYLAPLPGGQGYMLSGLIGLIEGTGAPQRVVTYMRRGQEESFAIMQAQPEGAVILPWGLNDPQGERVVAWLANMNPSAQALPDMILIDPADCTADGCDVQRQPGFPIWSPQGRLGLAVDLENNNVLYLPRGATRWQTAGVANMAILPFWIDEQRFGVVERRGPGSEQNLYAVDVQTGELTLLLTTGRLADSLPAADRNNPLGIVFAVRNSLQPGTLVIGTTGMATRSKSFLFSLDVTTAQGAGAVEHELALLATLDGARIEELYWPTYSQYSDRFPRLLTYRQGSARMMVYDLWANEVVLDTRLGTQEDFLNVLGQWSADQAWLAHSLGQAIHLFAPAQEAEVEATRKLLFHEFERCAAPVWVNALQP